jgi:hypothetical protein
VQVPTQTLRRPSLVPSTFGNEEECQAFQFFVEKTASLISVHSQPYLWTVHLPQASWQHACLKHSVIALASLHKSLTTFGDASQRATHTFIHHYNTAIRALVSDKPPIDVVLSACIMFWALENFHGGGQAAFDHMKAALKILGEWKLKRQQGQAVDDLIADHIEPAVRQGVKFAAQEHIEELAGQMEGLSLTTNDLMTINLQYPRFNSLKDAELYLVECIKMLIDLARQSRANVDPTFSFELHQSLELLEARLEKWMHFFQTLITTGLLYIRRLLVVHKAAANIQLEQLQTIQKTLSGVDSQESLQEAESVHNSPPLPGWCKSEYIVSEVTDMIEQTQTQTANDLLEDSPGIGLVPPLFLAATSALTIESRRNAVGLLRALDRQDGWWHSMDAAAVADAMLDIAVDCAVPHSMVELRDVNFSLDANLTTLHVSWQAPSLLLTGLGATRSVETRGLHGTDQVSLRHLNLILILFWAQADYLSRTSRI